VKPRKDKGVKRSVIEIISSDEEEIVERDFQRVKKRSKFESLHPTHERFGHPCDICATKLASVIHTTHSIVFCGRACIQEWKADRKKK
jgi:formamidopyrimidine-DNA glycosylase